MYQHWPSSVSLGSVVGVSSECWLHPAGYVSPGLPGADVRRPVRRGGQFGNTGGYNVATNTQAQEVHRSSPSNKGGLERLCNRT